ncbi:RidA family protein [Herbiconiux moechotypicola]|uniref:RidA family protein n=1 Tax=Herbiconiux moechotypicola TaxID=637393 RepID=A0ABP5Q2Z5_9MICO|nr:RidA family protein [Herbiconiux moechotypicola]MCS5728155.1 RidA family protein [Herbiconiux moechotypicola]
MTTPPGAAPRIPPTRLVLDELFASPVVPHAVVHDGTVHVSGLLGTVDAVGTLPASAADEFEAVLRNLFTVLSAARSAPDALLQLTVHLASIELLPEFNAVYARLLPDPLGRPARTTVASGLFGRCRVEVAATAFAVGAA